MLPLGEVRSKEIKIGGKVSSCFAIARPLILLFPVDRLQNPPL